MLTLTGKFVQLFKFCLNLRFQNEQMLPLFPGTKTLDTALIPCGCYLIWV